MSVSIEQLIERARAVRQNAQAPYSGFYVGAALLADDDTIHTGVNVESSSYGLTICAERVALTKALSEGKTGFRRIAIVVDTPVLTPPCGACRQLLYDYAPNLEIILANLDGQKKILQTKDIFPHPFGPDFLEPKT